MTRTSIFWGRDQDFTRKNVDNIIDVHTIDVLRKRRWANVETLGDVQSAPCADNSAASAAAKRQIKVSAKVEENAEGSAASKANLMRDSDALLTLVVSKSMVIMNSRGFYSLNSMTKFLFEAE